MLPSFPIPVLMCRLLWDTESLQGSRESVSHEAPATALGNEQCPEDCQHHGGSQWERKMYGFLLKTIRNFKMVIHSQPSVGSVWAHGPMQVHWLYVYKAALLWVSSMMSDSERDERYWHLLYCNVLREVTQSKPSKSKLIAAASHRLFSAHHRQGAHVHATGVQCAGVEVACRGPSCSQCASFRWRAPSSATKFDASVSLGLMCPFSVSSKLVAERSLSTHAHSRSSKYWHDYKKWQHCICHRKTR